LRGEFIVKTSFDAAVYSTAGATVVSSYRPFHERRYPQVSARLADSAARLR
jgi:hypothetical protein